MSLFESYLYWLDSNLSQLGINIGTFQTEFRAGQFEFALIPCYGIEAADFMLRLKQGIKEMSLQKNLEATFMSKPDLKDMCNGQHLNHSLWCKELKKNVFYNK